MRKTAKEIFVSTQKRDDLCGWLNEASIPEIQDFISISAHTINSGVEFHLSRAALDIRISKDQSASSERVEHHTVALIELTKALLSETKFLRWLTVGLLILTAGLLVFTVYLVVLEYRPHP